MADTEILLESGTNEIEIMQFTIFGEPVWDQCSEGKGDYDGG